MKVFRLQNLKISSLIDKFLLIILLILAFKYAGQLLIFFISFFLIGFLIIILIKRKKSEIELSEVIMDSVLISILESSSLSLFLATFKLNNMFNFVACQLLITLILTFIVLRLKVEIKINYSKLETIFFTSIPVMFATISFAFLDKFYTPDEYVYIRNAIDFTHGNYLVPFDFVLLREWSAFLTGRFLWQVTLASFIEATLGQLPYHIVNIPFLIMLLAAVYGLANIFLRNREKAFIVSLIIISNPLVVIFSNFVLIDFALTSLTFVSLYWFIKSFINGMNLYCLSKSFIVMFIALMYKFSFIVPMAIWIVFFFVSLKNKLYKLSRGHRLLFLIIVTPILAYELFLDIPALFTYYILHDLQLNSIFARYVFFSPLGMFINLFFKTPWTSRLWWEIPLSEKLFFFFSVLSPDILTPLITAFAILSPLVMRENREEKIFASISLLSLVIAFLGFLGYSGYWDVQRYGLPVILMLQLAGLTAFMLSLGKGLAIYAATIFMQMLTYLNYIVHEDKGYTFYLWATKPQDTYDNTFILSMIYSFSLLIFIGSRLLIISQITNNLRRKLIRNMQVLMLTGIFLSFIVNNISLTLYGVKTNSMFQDYGIKSLVFQLERLNNNLTLLVSNVYALPIYLKERWMVIPPPLEPSDLEALLKMGVGAKIAVSTSEIATWPASRLGINDLLLYELPAILVEREDNIGVPRQTFLKDRNILVHLSFINSTNYYTPFGSSLNIKIYGSPRWEYENQAKVLYFDGKKDYIVISGQPLYKSFQKLSVEVWFKTSRQQNGKFIVMGGYDNRTYNWGIYLSTNSTRLSFILKRDKVYSSIITGNFSDNCWHQFVGVFDGKSIVTYLDGKPVKKIVLDENLILNVSPGFKIYIGSWSAQSFFEGYIGGISIYLDVLEPMEVLNNYLLFVSNTTAIKGRIINVTDNYFIYDIKGRELQTYLNSNVSIIRATVKSIRVENQTKISLSVDIYAKNTGNATMLISTYYFSKFFSLNLKEGLNHLEFIFPLNIGKDLGRKIELILINNKGELLARTLTSVMLVEGLTIFPLLFIYFNLLVFYAYFSRHENI
jgi:4-amino-4-deoxy-L-arabinose transferase-like glycosyltransferase